MIEVDEFLFTYSLFVGCEIYVRYVHLDTPLDLYIKIYILSNSGRYERVKRLS